MTPPFLHLDLKPANLLVDENWVVKVEGRSLQLIFQDIRLWLKPTEKEAYWSSRISSVYESRLSSLRVKLIVFRDVA
jgi:hypothetical protein